MITATTRGRLARLSLIATLTVARAVAAPPLTTIQDTLYRADGTPYSGYLQIEWKSFEASDSTQITSQSISLRIYKGLFKTQLVPTTNASAGAFYTVRYVSDGKLQALETWAVPPSSSALRVTDVRVATAPTTLPPGGAGTTVNISDVVGLQEELELRPRKGSGFSTNRAAIINGFGEIEGALGAASDCITVEGTGVLCGGSGGGSVAFIDGDTPVGAVNGVNTVFSLSYAPNPASSVLLYRNGLLQRLSLDYNLSGTTITFLTGATPQTGDILLATYRLTGSGSAAPQILCSSVGTATSAASATSLGACTIPAGLVQAGDRIEVSADFSHEGTAKAFTVAVKWGAATVTTRSLPATEPNVAAHVSLGVHTSNTAFGAQIWGSAAALNASAGSLTESYSAPLTIDLLGNLDTAGGDSVTLRNYTVVRYPVP